MYKHYVLFTFIWVWQATGYAQFDIIPAGDNGCQCDGVILYQPPNDTVSFDVSLFNKEDELIYHSPNNTGQHSIDNLCPSVFHIVATLSDNSIQDEYFNVPAGTNNPGSTRKVFLCQQDYNLPFPGTPISYDFTVESSTFSNTATWYYPNGQLLPANTHSSLNASTLNSGWYTCADSLGACQVTSGVYLQTNDPGSTTTYPICESYEPFQIFDFIAGTPDTIGNFFIDSYSAESLIPEGIYNPVTMSSATFVYVIDQLPGCTPVVSSIYIDEKQQRNAGYSNSIEVCVGSTPLNMLDHLLGEPDDDSPAINNDGYWTLPNSGNLIPLGNDIFNPQTMSAGDYTYIVNSPAPCVTQSATLSITFIEPPQGGESNTVDLCSSSEPIELLSLLEGNATIGGVWTNSSGSEVDGLFDPSSEPAGIYTYSVYAIGCPINSATLTINSDAPVSAGENASISLCQFEPTINLLTYLSNNITEQGSWYQYDELTNPEFTPSSAGLFDIYYVVESLGCGNDTSLFSLYVQPAIAQLLDTTITLCELGQPVNLNQYFTSLDSVYFLNPISNLPISAVFQPQIQNSADYIIINPSGNDCPDQQGLISIQVNAPEIPQMEIVASDSILCLGEEVSFLCFVEANAENGSYEWFINGESTGDFDASYITAELTPGSIVNCLYTDTTACISSQNNYAINPEIITFEVPNVTITNDSLGTENVPGSSYTWYLDGEPLSGFNQNIILPQVTGAYSVQLTNSGCYSPISDEVLVFMSSVAESGINDVLISPNPANNYLNIRTDSGYYTVKIFNSFGQLVFFSQSPTTIETSAFPQGIYFVQIESGITAVNASLIIEHFLNN
ncbi:MAG: T9SS type A sorting domain-containing protein [Flavobacteriales bacterium]|jgi:hypothetical protein